MRITPSDAPFHGRIDAILATHTSLDERQRREQAKAIISSMIEPTSAMIAAGDAGVVTAATWRAMIKAALDEA